MKTLIASALLATAAFAGTAQAMSPSNGDLNTIRSYAPNADVSGLTAAEAASIVAIIHGGDTEGQKRSLVKNALR